MRKNVKIKELPVIKPEDLMLLIVEGKEEPSEIVNSIRYAKTEDIVVESGKIFTREQLQVQPSDPMREYYSRRERGEDIGLTLHWGQRKLLINEIEFLTYFWNPEEVPNPIIVYAGAASGIHIPIIPDLFSEIHEMHLYDPAKFAIRETDKIKIHNDYFTDEIAKEWSGRDDVFFVSDIRVRPGAYEQFTPEENERMIVEDNQRQRRWVELMQPVQAHLKFRTPFPVSEEFYKLDYFQGDIFYQPWAPVTSTETRLVPHYTLEKSNKIYKTKVWDSIVHEEQLFYHNTINRSYPLYSNFFLEQPNEIPIDPPELLNDYDSVAEAFILRDYLRKYKRRSNVIAVSKLSKFLTKMLNRLGRTRKTLSGMRENS